MTVTLRQHQQTLIYVHMGCLEWLLESSMGELLSCSLCFTIIEKKRDIKSDKAREKIFLSASKLICIPSSSQSFLFSLAEETSVVNWLRPHGFVYLNTESFILNEAQNVLFQC